MGEIDIMKELDEAVWAVLPPNSTLDRITRSGATNWSTGLKVDITAPSGPQSYFLKVATHPEGITMCKSEFFCQEALHAAIPDNVSLPVAWGVFRSDPSVAFYLTRFRRLRPTPVDPEQLAKILHRLHTTTARPLGSPYGFDVVTAKGYTPQVVDWATSWPEVFAAQWEISTRAAVGDWEYSDRTLDVELRDLATRANVEVVPRLLGAISGELARPVLCHADLWQGNVELDEDTGDLVIFDPACMYAPGEFELMHFVAERYTFKQPHIDAYVAAMGGVAEPKDEFPDRVMLYNLRNELQTIGTWDHLVNLADGVKVELRRLLAKYGSGAENTSGSGVFLSGAVAVAGADAGTVTGLEKAEALVSAEAVVV